MNLVPPQRNPMEALEEFGELTRLVETYGGIVILRVVQKRGRPSAKTFVGEGKAHEIAQLVRDLRADVVVINGFLKANQSNHLINIVPCEVLDRFEMILKIFQKHAHTPEAKLALQIAENTYEFPKLFGRGAALSQQAAGMGISTGGAGGRRAARGPGEKILEVKRRHFREQINRLEGKLEQFRAIRRQQRLRRTRKDFSTVALVGYTNSGKSTLLKALTGKKNIVIADKLFSTLDTRLGQLKSEGSHKILIADTIGFMQNLPPVLFSSFMATLEEVQEADALIHVVDASDPRMEKKMTVVREVLERLGCAQMPTIIALNKSDATNEARTQMSGEVQISALRGTNIDALIKGIQTVLE